MDCLIEITTGLRSGLLGTASAYTGRAGVKPTGIDDSIWTDHVDVRPRILMLLGLRDSYGWTDVL